MTALQLIGVYVGAACGTLGLGLTARWIDRKVTAMVQYRKGPPWYQPVADVLKLFYKETLMPSTARGTGFLLAPAVALAAVALVAAVLWMAVLAPTQGFVGDLIVVIYLLLVPPIATIVGASASGNPHAALGASREMKLILAYELPFILALLVAIVHTAGSTGQWTLKLGTIASASPALYSVSGVIAFVVSLLAVQAKLGGVPFDMAEAECEIMSGVFVEYSGTPLALIYLSRAMLLAVMPLVLIAVFWGGMGAGVLGVLAFVGKYVLILVLLTLLRNTNPRLRIDQAVKFFWWLVAPLAAAALVLALVGQKGGLWWL